MMAADETILNLKSNVLPELPIKTTTKILTQTEGRGLKQNTRGSKALVEAVMFGYPWVSRWNDDYVANKLDDLMSLAISMDGAGRRDMIDCLDAGGTVPDAYYNNGENRKGDTAYVRMRE